MNNGLNQIIDAASTIKDWKAREEKVTLQQFIIVHPNVTLHVLSPGGFINIPANFLDENLSAHLGVSNTEMLISWEEIKDQVVLSSDETDGIWHLLTNY